MSNTVLVVAIAGFSLVALLAYESYLQAQNSVANQVGKAIGSGLTTLLEGAAL